ncbi:MAG: AEC family transporter [Symploca sp. SIO3C6]|uniref:AEC family transporter n=1 Tax=Symploca sp. SIO1C4 TaxID=2607765 RepID=A0A6B3NB96_9CYAN|nr:AEC family transporter [Symploca sp. SIO3C6]NER27852.1 AEC family transporter [Symploca sp. SIO1C4]NET06037.1 AEC family transporter [Symploca sp. SIO2B6]
MIAILSTVFPVGLIVFVGFVAGKTLQLEISTLSSLSLYVLFPVLVIDSLYRTTLGAENAIGIFLGFIVTYFLLCLAAWLLGQILNLSVPVQKSLVATTAFPNNGNLGLPITLFALGESGLERAIVYMIASSIVILTTAPVFLMVGSFWSVVRLTLKLPLIWAILLGLGLHWSNVQLPFKIGEGLHLLAQAPIPVALLILGMQIASNRFQLKPYEVAASLMRLVGGALTAYLVGKTLGLTGLDLQVLVLQSSMPTAITAFLLVNEFGGDAARTARVVVLSTLLAFLTLPMVLWAITVAT